MLDRGASSKSERAHVIDHRLQLFNTYNLRRGAPSQRVIDFILSLVGGGACASSSLIIHQPNSSVVISFHTSTHI
eukprot:scaffold4943_cov127-Isochrysis_galbana.AAC.1